MLELITVAIVLALGFVAAAWSLLFSPVLRPKLQAIVGSASIAIGVGSFFLMFCGLIAPYPLAATASADDASSRNEALKENKPAADEEVSSAESPTTPGPASLADEEPADDKPASDDTLHEPPVVDEAASKVVIPPGRPEWVESLPVRVGSVHTTAVCSGPYVSQKDASQALDNELVNKTREYIAEHIGSPLATNFIRYNAQQIKTRLIRPENIYSEEIGVSIGPMQQVHALLEFGPEFRAEIDRHWAAEIGKSRLLQMGLFAGGVLCLLGTVSGYFRLDNATRGYYTARLQAMAAIAILVLLGIGLFFGRMIPWL